MVANVFRDGFAFAEDAHAAKQILQRKFLQKWNWAPIGKEEVGVITREINKHARLLLIGED
jgi:hypothetical protein